MPTKGPRDICDRRLYHSGVRIRAVRYCGVQESNPKFHIIDIANDAALGTCRPTCA